MGRGRGGTDLTPQPPFPFGGGGQMAGGAYSLSGTVGQADAGAVMSGGSYSLSGGFWGGAASQSTIYSPLVLRNSAGS
ncbi:MAG: hypothetical protein ACUVWR_18770 [Anaerolineae bacterium]